jgi:hypothetical protein
LWRCACHTVDLLQYQCGEVASEAFGLQGPKHATLGVAMDMSIGVKVPSGAIGEKREPNASLARRLPAMRTLDRIEKSLR